jgi:hypothetical protein
MTPEEASKAHYERLAKLEEWRDEKARTRQQNRKEAMKDPNLGCCVKTYRRYSSKDGSNLEVHDIEGCEGLREHLREIKSDHLHNKLAVSEIEEKLSNCPFCSRKNEKP